MPHELINKLLERWESIRPQGRRPVRRKLVECFACFFEYASPFQPRRIWRADPWRA